MSKPLVIVESPTKAKTISRFLDGKYKVEASFGHVRDLPSSKMSIDIEHNFEPTYVIPPKSKKKVDELKKLAKDAPLIILATDEDREGEAIAWHLISALGLDKGKGKKDKDKIQRIAFHEITKTAIAEALAHPRDLDLHLVDAQQARRVLDRLVGYELSPFLWKKVKRGLSAGRVQSVALRLVVEREREIQKFKPQEYWSIETTFNKDGNFLGKLNKIDGKSLDKLAIKTEEQAHKIVADIANQQALVTEVTKKEVRRTPAAPFITSTLQQEAARKLGFSAKQTMMYAQQLYEGVEIGEEGATGLITYMRTDSVNLSELALSSAREAIESKYGKEYLLAEPRKYASKSKNAQEAHEAVRPTDLMRDPEKMKEFLDKNQHRLYDLIWKRTIATQMPEAVFDATSVDIEIVGSGKSGSNGKNYIFRATGQVIKFDGFMKVYLEGTDDEEAEEEGLLPELVKGDKPKVVKTIPKQHFTQPPPRYSDATLIKALEEQGIGRPSTYAPTLTTIQERDYVSKIDKKYSPTDMGFIVNDILVEHFPEIVDLQFTAKMEEELDEIAEGTKEWVPVIREFYTPFHKNLKAKEKEVERHVELLDEKCPLSGHQLQIKFGRFGKFIACTNYPECKFTRPLPEEQKIIDENSGVICEKCGKPMTVKFGRFGSFLGCSGYPECKNIKKIQKGTGVTCPLCGEGELVEKKSKRGIFYACTKYPQCKFTLNAKPTGEKCPKSNDLLVEMRDGGLKCSNKDCDYIREPVIEPEKQEAKS